MVFVSLSIFARSLIFVFPFPFSALPDKPVGNQFSACLDVFASCQISNGNLLRLETRKVRLLELPAIASPVELLLPSPWKAE